MAFTTRSAMHSDRQALKLLWKRVFLDSDEEIDTFFRFYFEPQMVVVVADNEDVPVAAGYVLPIGNLLCNELSIPCAMIYSVATHPEYRNHGFGTSVVRDLISIGFSKGFKTVVLSPSRDDLFEYYSSRTLFQDWFYVSERKYKTSPHLGNAVELSSITVNDYYRLREDLLSGIPHIEFDLPCLSYQLLLSRRFGGDLFRVDTPGGIGCAVVEKQSDGAVWVKELLTSNICETVALSAVASMFPANEYLVRSPAFSKNLNSKTRRFGMLASPDNLINIESLKTTSPYYGLAFD